MGYIRRMNKYTTKFLMNSAIADLCMMTLNYFPSFICMQDG
jgi:hypothetical protein